MTDAPRCATCKWWDPESKGVKSRICDLLSYRYVEGFDANNGVGIVTGPDFGCVLHEPKEQVEGQVNGSS